MDTFITTTVTTHYYCLKQSIAVTCLKVLVTEYFCYIWMLPSACLVLVQCVFITTRRCCGAPNSKGLCLSMMSSSGKISYDTHTLLVQTRTHNYWISAQITTISLIWNQSVDLQEHGVKTNRNKMGRVADVLIGVKLGGGEAGAHPREMGAVDEQGGDGKIVRG